MNLKSKSGEIEAGLIGLLMFVFVFGGSLVVHCIKSANERDTFNKFKAESVPEATFKDAFWSELRIEANGK